jgi:hypothetical protein
MVNPSLVSCISDAVLPSLNQTLAQRFCLLISAIRKSGCTLGVFNIKHTLRSSTEGYGCKTHWSGLEQSSTIGTLWQEAVPLAILGRNDKFGNFLVRYLHMLGWFVLSLVLMWWVLIHCLHVYVKFDCRI